MNLKTLQSSIECCRSNGIGVLGAIVQWTVKDDARIDRSVLWSDVAADVREHLPPHPSASKSLRRAITKFNSSKVSRGAEVRSIGKDNALGSVYAIVSIAGDPDAKDAIISKQEWLRLDIDGTLTGSHLDDPTSHGSDIKSMLDSTLWARDIRMFVSSVVLKSFGSFSTRSGGSCYFTPERSLQRLEDLQDSMRNAGVPIHWMTLPILGDDYTKESLAGEYERKMLSDLDSFERKLDTFFNDGRKKRTDSTANKSSELDDLLDQTTIYEALLGKHLSKIRDRISDLDKHIVDSFADAAGDEPEPSSDAVSSTESDIDKIIRDLESIEESIEQDGQDA